MKWTPELHDKMMDLMSDKLEEFRNHEFEKMSLPEKLIRSGWNFHVARWWNYLESVGMRLVEEIFPKAGDEVSVPLYDKMCDSHMRDIHEETGMFPCYMPGAATKEDPVWNKGREFKGILIPMDLAEKIFIMGGLP
jgi:hypothetical protein